jgi:uncharacterized protein YndB with AHSA1/START domain
MQTVSVDVARDPDTCWRAFVDVAQLPRWVPGLKRAEILTRAKGLPEEVHFEFAREHAYTLVYSYDKAEHVVRWQPKLGKNAGVTGFVRFEAIENGWTRLTYGLEQGDARGPAERELGDLQRLAEAFSSHVQR